MKELRSIFEDKQSVLRVQFEELECLESSLVYAREYAENLLHYGSPVSVMSAKNGMESQIKETITSKARQELAEDDYIEFIPSVHFCQTQALGEVVSRAVYEITDACQETEIGEEINVTLVVTTSKQVTMPGNVRAMMKLPNGKTEEVEVKGNEDSSISVRYHPQMIGEHKLSITAYRTSLMASPAKINVIPSKGLLYEFGTVGSGVGQLRRPRGVTLMKNGNILICEEENNRMQLFTLDGTHRKFIEFTDFAKPFVPMYSAVSDDGSIFTTDYNNSQIVVHDENGTLIHCFGADRLTVPMGIAVGPTNGNVYVADCFHRCIMVYSQRGEHITTWSSGKSPFSSVRGVTVDRNNGNVIVSDHEQNCIHVFNSEGAHLCQYGGRGREKGKFCYPDSLATDKNGSVYVCEFYENRIQKFDANGKSAACIYSGYGLSWPSGICITDDPSGHVIVAEYETGCVKVFTQ